MFSEFGSLILPNYEKSIALLALLFAVSLVSFYFINDSKVFAATETFSADGQISSLVLGMTPSTYSQYELCREIYFVWRLEVSY